MRSQLLAVAVVAAAAVAGRADTGLTKGTPELKSATALAFGPKGILFIADPQGAAIFAVDTGDVAPAGDKPVAAERIDSKLAAVLGTTEKEIKINDLKVNPASGNVYISVSRGSGMGIPVIARYTREGKVEPLTLKDVPFAKVTLPNAAEKQRLQSITNMAFVGGKLIVAGLSNEEFASTLRSIPFPFTEADKGTAVEIFHGAHGKTETQAPIRTFIPYTVGKEETILAAYTCTPIVKVPVADLKPGTKVKGTTIAELGNRNTPIDMIVYSKDGKEYFLVANSARGVMKIAAEQVGAAEAITARPKGETAGLKYETIAELKDVMQLDKLNDTSAVLLVKTGSGYDLKTITLP